MPDLPDANRNDGVRRVARKVRSLVSSDDTGEPRTPDPAEPGSAPDRGASTVSPGKAAARGERRVDRRFARAFWRVGRTVLGSERLPDAWEGMAFDQELGRELTARVRRVSAEAVFVEKVRTGAPVLDAAVATVRALIDIRDTQGARAFAVSLSGLAELTFLEPLGRGLVAHFRLRYRIAWDQFKLVPPEPLARHAPCEAVDGAFVEDNAESRDAALAIVALLDELGTRELRRWPAVPGRRLSRRRPSSGGGGGALGPRRARRRGLRTLANQCRWTHPVTLVPPRGCGQRWRHRLPVSGDHARLAQPGRLRPDPGHARDLARFRHTVPRGRRPRSAGHQPAGPDPAGARAGRRPMGTSTWSRGTGTSATATRSPRTPG